MFDAAISSYGAVDILVSNAGLQQDFSLVEMSFRSME
jgi:NAD(P)-dependent dehydrogenase (short-subunit alcohol dehydrogenase family)